MAVVETITETVDPEHWPTPELESALVGMAQELAVRQCHWLELLAVFDRREGWRADGQLTCVAWLMWRCGLGYSTAKEKLRVAHELRRRPAVQAAFAAGELSYAKVRAITRVVDAGQATDEWLLRLAEVGTCSDLDRAARHFEKLRDQERGVDDYLARFDRRALRASRTFDGMLVIEAVLPIEEGEEFLSNLRVAVDKASTGAPTAPAAQRRLDALLELSRHAHDGHCVGDTSGADRYTLHLLADVDALAGPGDGRAELLNGAPVAIETLRRMACDCGVVRHLLRGKSEPLDIGRRTSVWTAAQRRAILLRDGGKCRFPGCENRTVDIHHVEHYADGGATATSNGMPACPRHHTLLHEGGFSVSGDANGELIFRRPDGIEIAPTGRL
jgi:hypothetical protein